MGKSNKNHLNESKMKVFAKWRHNENYQMLGENKKKKLSFVPIPHTLLMNENFIRLKDSSKKIYLYMTDYANGQEITTFPKSIYEKITTKETFSNAIKELVEYGFIEIIGFGKNTRTANIYKFIDKWKYIKLPEKQKRKPNFNNKK